MTYCGLCCKVTNNNKLYEYTEDFSSQFKLVIIICETCRTEKIRYLEENNNGI